MGAEVEINKIKVVLKKRFIMILRFVEIVKSYVNLNTIYGKYHREEILLWENDYE